MKYFFIVIALLMLARPAEAAKTVSGIVPKMQPLQPPPTNVQPNFSGSVEYNGAPPPGVPAAAAATASAPAPVSQVPASAPPKISWPWWLLALLLVAAAVFVAVRKFKRP